MNRFISLSLFTKSFSRQSFVIKSQSPVALVTAPRYYSSSVVGSKAHVEETMSKIEELFSIAKDEIEYAEESQGTTYYHEDLTTAEKAVNDVLTTYKDFLDSLPSEDMKSQVNTKIGMKMKELKMDFDALPEEGH